VLLERYVQRLEKINQVGDVLIESRAKKENRQLERAYKYIYANGSDHVPAKIFQRRLTSVQLKIKRKSENVSGLQAADLIASPSCRSLICEKTGTKMTADFARRIEEVLIKSKYLRRWDGEITGWAKKWLPQKQNRPSTGSRAMQLRILLRSSRITVKPARPGESIRSVDVLSPRRGTHCVECPLSSNPSTGAMKR
jgi:hypothetical protein